MIKKQICSGIILLELLIATLLSVLLVGTLMKMYISNQERLHLLKSLNQIQDHAQRVIEILESAVNQAGFIGCAYLQNGFPIYSSHSLLDANNKLSGIDNELTVRHMSYPTAMLAYTMRDDFTLVSTNEVRFKKGDKILISDCTQADIFTIAKVIDFKNLQKIISTEPMHKRYSTYAELGHLEINTYLLAQTHRTSHNDAIAHSLFVKQQLNNRKYELVAGIEQLKFTYYFIQNGRLIIKKVKDIHDWSKLVGIGLVIKLKEFKLEKTWHAFFALRNK